jgi:2-dehydropantoate 2-reductase
MRILLLGAGAVGSWIGVNLLRAGNDVVFVGRRAFVDAAASNGVRVALPQGGDWHLTPVRARVAVADAMRDGPFDASVLCVKTYAIATALDELTPHAERIGQLVTFQNGVGAEEDAAARFGAARVTAATLTSPISQRAPGSIALDRLGGGVGLADVDPGSGFAHRLQQAARTDLMPVDLHADYRAMKWSKMLLNIVGNAASAIHDLDVAQVYADPRLFADEMAMVRECLAVMRALKIPVVNLPGYSARSFARVVSLLPNALARVLLASRVSRGRGGKRPSFYYDVVNKTGRSEVTALNGQIAAHGARLGIPTPVNARLTKAVLAGVR